MRKNIVLSLLISFSFLLVETSYSADIDEINAAIQAKGGKWVAGETSVSGLPRELKQKRANAKVDTPDRLKGHAARQRNRPTQRAGTSTFLGCNVNLSVCDYTNLSGKSFVTAVKDQGNCGACWAFAATELLESESELSFLGQNYWDSFSPGLTVTNLDLSPQIVLSCTNPSVDNCENGGYLSDAANFLQSYGTNLETCYPYTQTDGSCSNACSSWLDPSSDYYVYGWSGEQCLDACSFTSSSCDTCPSEGGISWYIQRMKDLLQFGPLVAWMEVFDDFYSYKSGVYSCTSDDYIGNHFIEVIGWDDNQQAFHCKNSWGTGWGEAGFFWISYNELQSAALETDNGATNFAHWVYWFEGGKHTPKVNVTSVPTGLTLCTLNESSIDCGASTPYSFEFETGTSNTIATPLYQNLGSCYVYKFSQWTGNSKFTHSADSNYAYVTFTEPPVAGEKFTAQFTENVEPTFQVTPSGAGNITWKPFNSSYPYPYFSPNSSATLTAVPSSEYAFIGWTGSVTSAKNPVSVKMAQVGPSGPCQVVTANFASFSLTQPPSTLTSGSSYAIEWTVANAQIPLTYGIFYSTNGTTWKIVATGLSSTSYSWTVPSVTKPTTAYIKVVCYNGKTGVNALKSSAFTITN